MFKVLRTGVVVSILAIPWQVGAEESKGDGQESDLRLLDEVVVTASRVVEHKNEVSANLTIISHEELSQSTARNIGDVLTQKGLGHVQKYPGNLTSVSIRGFRSDTHGNDLQGHVLVLLDGRRAGTGNVAKILTKNVERVEIIRGPGAVQYGSAGMGGVVNIITRQGTTNSLFAEAGVGSFNAYEGSVGGSFARNGFDFAGSVTYKTVDDYDTGSGDRYKNSGVNYETGVSANLGYTLSGKDRIGIVITSFELDEAGNPGYLSSNDLDDTSDKSNYSIDISYNGESATSQYSWLVRTFFGQDENSWLDPVESNPSGWDDGELSENKTDQRGAQAQISGLFGATTLTTGADWLDYEVENSWTPNETSYTNPAIFLLAKMGFLGDQLNANIGLRYDWYEVEVNQSAGGDETTSHFTPKLGLAWMVTDGLKLRAQYGMGFMMPSADQLAADYSSWGNQIVGNPDLDPEESTTYEGGFDYNQAGFSGSLTYFHTDFSDKIVNVSLAGGESSWDNSGDATISGFEMELSYDLGLLWQWDFEVRPYLGMTLLTEFEDDETGEDLQYISALNYGTGLMVMAEGLSCRFNLAYAGSQDVIDYESGSYEVVNLARSLVADLFASFQLMEFEPGERLTLHTEVRNCFDEDYAYVKGYPMAGRSFYAGLRLDY